MASRSKSAKINMPKWMECTWRRVPCDKDRCKVCGPMKRHREHHMELGEDPDCFQSAISDIGGSLTEALEMIKKDAAAKGIDITNIATIKEPPKPDKFPLYKKIRDWRREVHRLIDTADQDEEMWLYTPEGEDLMWYSSLLPQKVYRQHCNRWHIKTGDGYGDFDYDYTRYVLEESIKILKHSISELLKMDSGPKSKFLIALTNLQSLETKIAKI